MVAVYSSNLTTKVKVSRKQNALNSVMRTVLIKLKFGGCVELALCLQGQPGLPFGTPTNYDFVFLRLHKSRAT
eukprot:4116505-Pyramimonas_sp.AAC.3